MPFEITWDEKALDSLSNFESILSKRIFKKINELSINPFSFSNVKKLKGMNRLRLRVGDYRIIFRVKENVIQILKVSHRKNIYDKI